MGGVTGLFVLAVSLVIPVVAIVALVRTSLLRGRIELLERQVQALRKAAAQDRPVVQQPVNERADKPAAVQSVVAPPSPDKPARPDWPSPPAAAAPAPEPDLFERATQTVWRWFTEGNVPAKVGMVVLFAGVGALLKYAADHGWMRFPIELRLAGIALAALAGLAFGWKQRRARRAFALAVQGGAIGVLLMTSFAAYKLYGLVGPLPAFALWVLLATAAGLLAVWQEARALAVLGILAGFLAPILMSTGSGNHVVLFTFYAVLNAAIFAIAWLRSWRELNLLGFAFTFGIGTFWGWQQYRPEHFASTWPFLLLFFVFYLLIPVLHARRGDADRDPLDASLVFGTPLVSFALLAGLLEGERMPLAVSAVAVAALYGLLAWRVVGATAPLLQLAHRVLAVGFATLAVPLALSAHATASVFALEGAAMVWLGLKQGRRLPVAAGGVLQVLAAAWFLRGNPAALYAMPVANAGFMGMLLLALAGISSALSHARAGNREFALLWYLWATGWWLAMGIVEVDHFVPAHLEPDAWLAFAALSIAAASLLPRGQLHDAPGWTIAAGMGAAVALAVLQGQQHGHPFSGWGVLAWALFAVFGVLALHRQRESGGGSLAWAHSTWLLAWALASSLWLRYMTREAGLAAGWIDAATALPWLLMGAGLLLRPGVISWPVAHRFASWRDALMAGWQVLLAVIALLLLLQSGASAPLPWIPLLNPLELSLTAAMLLLGAWVRSDMLSQEMRYWRAPLVCLLVFLTSTSCTLRAVHQLGDLPWSLAMLDTAMAQAALSLVWSALGVAGWIAGSRRRQRDLWLAGAILMGVVLAKLVLVDRVHLGNLPGIASFIGYGLLCTFVGYLAPAPPRTQEA